MSPSPRVFAVSSPETVVGGGIDYVDKLSSFSRLFGVDHQRALAELYGRSGLQQVLGAAAVAGQCIDDETLYKLRLALLHDFAPLVPHAYQHGLFLQHQQPYQQQQQQPSPLQSPDDHPDDQLLKFLLQHQHQQQQQRQDAVELQRRLNADGYDAKHNSPTTASPQSPQTSLAAFALPSPRPISFCTDDGVASTGPLPLLSSSTSDPTAVVLAATSPAGPVGATVDQLQQQLFPCPDCGRAYSTPSNLARHRQSHRGGGGGRDGGGSDSPPPTSTHERRRSVDGLSATTVALAPSAPASAAPSSVGTAASAGPPRKCPHCDKVYASAPAYSMHVRTHSQGCACPQCGKRFSRPWLLQGHLRTHTGEKPFRCQHCGKTFADKSNLRAHVQTHSADKPHVCGRCGKAFALRSYLYKHEESSCMRSHRLFHSYPYLHHHHQASSVSASASSSQLQQPAAAGQLQQQQPYPHPHHHHHHQMAVVAAPRQL